VITCRPRTLTDSRLQTITLCGSMRLLPQFDYWKRKLKRAGYRVFAPTLVNYRVRCRSRETALRVKRRENRKHFEKIKRSDAILVLNYSRRKSPNYIGGSTFGEIAVAFSMGKRIFLVNPIPRDSTFREELQAWGAERWHDLNRTGGKT